MPRVLVVSERLFKSSLKISVVTVLIQSTHFQDNWDRRKFFGGVQGDCIYFNDINIDSLAEQMEEYWVIKFVHRLNMSII